MTSQAAVCCGLRSALAVRGLSEPQAAQAAKLSCGSLRTGAAESPLDDAISAFWVNRKSPLPSEQASAFTFSTLPESGEAVCNSTVAAHGEERLLMALGAGLLVVVTTWLQREISAPAFVG